MTFKTVVKYFDDNLQYCKELLILMKRVEQIEAYVNHGREWFSPTNSFKLIHLIHLKHMI